VVLKPLTNFLRTMKRGLSANLVVQI
jgi:hypothetical protein